MPPDEEACNGQAQGDEAGQEHDDLARDAEDTACMDLVAGAEEPLPEGFLLVQLGFQQLAGVLVVHEVALFPEVAGCITDADGDHAGTVLRKGDPQHVKRFLVVCVVNHTVVDAGVRCCGHEGRLQPGTLFASAGHADAGDDNEQQG